MSVGFLYEEKKMSSGVLSRVGWLPRAEMTPPSSFFLGVGTLLCHATFLLPLLSPPFSFSSYVLSLLPARHFGIHGQAKVFKKRKLLINLAQFLCLKTFILYKKDFP